MLRDPVNSVLSNGHSYKVFSHCISFLFSYKIVKCIVRFYNNVAKIGMNVNSTVKNYQFVEKYSKCTFNRILVNI